MNSNQEEFTITTDHEEIRNWIEEQDGRPGLVNSEENDGRGILTIIFDNESSAEELSWQEFFDTFESLQLAFRYDTTDEEQDMFAYSFVSRDEQEREAEDNLLNTEMPEDNIPIENLYPSASALDVNIDTADSLQQDSDQQDLSEL